MDRTRGKRCERGRWLSQRETSMLIHVLTAGPQTRKRKAHTQLCPWTGHGKVDVSSSLAVWLRPTKQTGLCRRKSSNAREPPSTGLLHPQQVDSTAPSGEAVLSFLKTPSSIRSSLPRPSPPVRSRNACAFVQPACRPQAPALRREEGLNHSARAPIKDGDSPSNPAYALSC